MEAKEMAWAIAEYECLVNRFTPMHGPLTHARQVAFWDTVSRVPRDTFVTVLVAFKSTWNQRNRHNEPVSPSPSDILQECRRIDERKRVEKMKVDRDFVDSQSKPMVDADMETILDEADIPGEDSGRRILRRTKELMQQGLSPMKASSQAFAEICGR